MLDANGTATVNDSTAIVTLHNNLGGEAALQVSTLVSQMTVSKQFACNLHPAVGDVDLGNVVDEPIGVLVMDSNLSLDVRVNAGTFKVGAVEIVYYYNASLLQLLQVTAGVDWPGGIFLATTNDRPGVVKLGGAAMGFAGLATVATMLFEVLDNGDGSAVAFEGRVVT